MIRTNEQNYVYTSQHTIENITHKIYFNNAIPTVVTKKPDSTLRK